VLLYPKHISSENQDVIKTEVQKAYIKTKVDTALRKNITADTVENNTVFSEDKAITVENNSVIAEDRTIISQRIASKSGSITDDEECYWVNKDTKKACDKIELQNESSEKRKPEQSNEELEKEKQALVSDMVIIPKGRFFMGCDHCYENQAPQHSVNIQSFKLAIHEVSVYQFSLFVKDTKYYSDHCKIPHSPFMVYPVDANWENPYFSQTDIHPVVCVSYNDVLMYIHWLNKLTGKVYRLPTESEWEYSAKAGKMGQYYWESGLFERANCRDCDSEWDYRQTVPIGTFEPNAFGLFDMHGNVWEWVQDCYVKSYVDAPMSGEAVIKDNCNHRILRGGSWLSLMIASTLTLRYPAHIDLRRSSIGFRLAQDLKN
jgi:formylglycine-generating enzyme required for sulfatase activity